MSNRLTFSLASLIVLIGLLAAPAFVHAETVSTVTFTSNGPYGPGDKVQATVTFSGAVDVTATSTGPYLSLSDDNGGVGNLIYASGTGTATLVFESAALGATDGSTDTDGFGISANITVGDPNGTINDAGTTTAATVTFGAVDSDATQTVDRAAPGYNPGTNVPTLISQPPYHVGDKIEVRLTFSEPMADKGLLNFQIGNGTNPDRFLTASSAGTPANTLTFSYTVKAGDSGLARLSQQPLSRSITDVLGNKIANNTDLITGGNDAVPIVLGNVSTTQPTVDAVAITSTGPYTDTTATTGDAIAVTVTFSEAVKVTGTPQIALTIGDGTAQANYASGTGTTALVFSYAIVAADAGAVSIAANALALNRGTINADDAFENPAVLTHAAVVTSEGQLVDSAAPTVTAVAITSKADADDDEDIIYVTGEKITAELTFSEDVTVKGKPTLILLLWTEEVGYHRTATYDKAASGTKQLVFSYEVTKDDSSDISVQVGGNSLTLGSGVTIQDAVKNDANPAHVPSKQQIATVNPDTTPPVATPSIPVLQKDGTVDFVFTFDEPLGTGFNDLEVTDFTIDGAHQISAAQVADRPTIDRDGTVYTLTVTPLTASSAVTVTLNANTVKNLAGITGPAASVTRIYRPAVADTTPKFVNTTVANLGPVCKGDNIQRMSEDGTRRLIVQLPEADDNEGDTLTYTLNPALPAGLSWRTTDAQRRVIEGTPINAGTTTHTWTATDDSPTTGDPSKDSASITFSIVVEEHQKPNKPETPAAKKKDAPVTAGQSVDRVVLTWNQPSAAVAKAERAYPNCIPAVTGYTVTETMWDDVSQDFVSSMTYESATGTTYADHFIAPETDTTDTLWTFTTPKKDHGIYKYTIMAHNSSPAKTSVASEFATWAVTGGIQIVVADPPAAPKDLDAAIDQDGNSVTLNWLKVPAADEGGAPIDDSAMATRTKYYGVDKGFGGYVVYRVNDATKEAKRLPNATDFVDPVRTDGVNFFDHPTYRDANIPAGQYVYRVTAANIAGESLRSISTKIITIVGESPNRAPNFGDATVADITATVGKAITGRILPEATDADGDTLTYSITPDVSTIGLTFDPQSRLLNGTPTAVMAETVYTYKAEDTADPKGSDTIKFLITVKDPAATKNNPPTFGDATVAGITATVGQAIAGRFLPEATDAEDDADDLTYSITPDLPAGLNFDEDTRALTGTPTAAMAETPYTYKVEDTGEASDTIGFFITVKAATAGPGTGTPTTSLPAGGHVVFVRSLASAPTFGTSNPMIAEWSAMPNLYELFTQGGGGSLQLNVTGVNARQVVMSEVMWAVDEGKVGQDSYDGQQWIEVHNRTASAIPISSISFATKNGRPALPQGTDLISNVVGAGDAWIRTKGQNGNSTAGNLKEFISMYRKRYHNDSAGWNGGEWLASTNVYHPNHKGTPGVGEPKGPQTFPASGVALNTVFNEIANHPSGNHNHEWIELRIKNGDPHFENYVVDMVTGASDRAVTTNPTQTRLFKMPKLNTGRYDKILLITKTDPARDDDHPLRGGYNVERADADQDNEGRDKNIRYYVADDWNTDLPDNGEFVLILRHGADKTNHEKVEDLAGYHPNLKVETASFFSNLWPLRGYPAPNLSNNKIAAGQVDRRDKPDIPGTKTQDGNKIDKVAFRSDNNGWTGVGYKRNAKAGAQNGGTPGYPNNALLSNETQAGADPVIISEIMYATGDRGNLPQWIELRNTSQTNGVNLDGWRVTIVNHDQDIGEDGGMVTYAGDLVKSYNISGKIPPGQTFLVVAHSGTDNTNLPSERIAAIAKRRGDVILSQYGFEITVEAKEKDGKRKEADTVGNLADVAEEDARVRGNPQSYADPAWMLPAGTTEAGDRVSIVRRYERDTLLNGLDAEAWQSFDMTVHINAPESTYYGNRNDLASPGYTVDSVLPVSLSKFRPERLATGEVAVRWVTESETNNAGFNILRGEALDGEFTKLNTQLIEGKGTTSERTAYEFVDKSAKPNVIYYYQIQDVSLDGEVVTLKTTHMRGNISVVGKLTTTWGELKALQ